MKVYSIKEHGLPASLDPQPDPNTVCFMHNDSIITGLPVINSDCWFSFQTGNEYRGITHYIVFDKPLKYYSEYSQFTEQEENLSVSEECTLLDYFASKAMQGIISSKEFSGMYYDNLSKQSYLIAKSMLNERKKIQP